MQDEIGDQSHPEDIGGIQSFPVLERDASGKLTPDCMAAIAIQGMLPGKVADEAERMEAEYQAAVSTMPTPIDKAFLPPFPFPETAMQRLAVWIARVPIDKNAVVTIDWVLRLLERRTVEVVEWKSRQVALLRKQIALLALNYQESQNKLGQMEVQRGFYDQYLLMQEGNTKFRAFLLENFPEEMKVADATNQPLIQFAQGLMLQLKSKVQ